MFLPLFIMFFDNTLLRDLMLYNYAKNQSYLNVPSPLFFKQNDKSQHLDVEEKRVFFR